MRLMATYWPRDRGPHWWLDYSLSTVRAELEMAAEAGMHSLQLSLLWSDFQVDGGRVAAGPMRDLESTLDTAIQFDIDLLVTLMPVVIGARTWLPSWLLDPLSWGDRPVLAGHSESRRAAVDLFQSESARNASARMVREAVAAFDDHPAVWGWVLGDRLAAISRPRTLAAFEHWLGTMADEARAARAAKPLFHGVSSRDVIESDVVDLAVMAQLGIAPTVSSQWRPAWARAGERVWSTFLAAYCSSFFLELPPGHGPVLVDVSGCPLDTVRLEEIVLGAHAGGAVGCSVPNLFSYAPNVQRSVPFDRQPAMLECGLLDVRGTPTRAGRALIELEPQVSEPRGRTTLFPSPDPEVRRRSPEAVARECYEGRLR